MPELPTKKLRETDLVNAWLWEFHREDPQWRRVRLGVVPTKELAREYMVLLRWCDAIFIHDNVVYILEAKLRPTAGAIGQLEHYAKLFKRTPEFKQWWGNPLKLVLLTTVVDLELVDLCSEKGIQYEVYEMA